MNVQCKIKHVLDIQPSLHESETVLVGLADIEPKLHEYM